MWPTSHVATRKSIEHTGGRTSSSVSVAQLSGVASLDYLNPNLAHAVRVTVAAMGSSSILSFDKGATANWDVSQLVWWDGTDTISGTLSTQIKAAGTCQLEGTLLHAV